MRIEQIQQVIAQMGRFGVRMTKNCPFDRVCDINNVDIVRVLIGQTCGFDRPNVAQALHSIPVVNGPTQGGRVYASL